MVNERHSTRVEVLLLILTLHAATIFFPCIVARLTQPQ
jgi:hypothetical protein